MLKSLVFSYLLLVFSCSSLVAKEPDSSRVNIHKNAVMLRVGVHYFQNTLGVLYERKLYTGEVLKPFVRIGYEFYSGIQGNNFDFGSLQVGMLSGKDDHHAELAIGYGQNMWISDMGGRVRWRHYSVYMGYRYEPPDKRIIITGGLAHLSRQFPGLNLGIGYTF